MKYVGYSPLQNQYIIDATWEHRKLGEVVGVYDGVHQTPDYKDSGIMFLSVENITTLESGKYISEEAFQRDYKVYPQKGDVLMTRIGDVGTPNVVETAEKVAFYVSLALLKPQCIDSYFLCNSILSPLFQWGLKERTLVTAIPKKINKDEIGKVDIMMPLSMVEQQQIGTFFRNLDNLITLHQREGKLSKQIFFDFCSSISTFAWEQRKFADMYDRVGEKNDLCYTKEQIISVANMYFKPDSYITDEEYLRTYNVFLLGDIAFEGNKSKNFAHGRFVENTIGNGIVSHVFDVFRPKAEYDLLYWKYAINNERLMGNILVRCTKASTMMTNLVANDFLNESVLAPSVAEQKKIGEYFDRLDNLITLHQRKQM